MTALARDAAPGEQSVSLLLGADDEAIGYFRAALAARPRALAGFVNLANALAIRGRDESAMDCWRRALEIYLDSAVVRVNMAISYLRQDVRALLDRSRRGD